jgi:peroxisomal coenzyme A diphosphatase NUDT7
MDDRKLPASFRIEQLCYLPFSLAKTELVVRPCVALLHSAADPKAPTVEESLMPRLDAKEVAAVFSAPLHNFLRERDEIPPGQTAADFPPGRWYEGVWTRWHDSSWRMHYFYVPVHDQAVARPRVREGGQAALAEEAEEEGAPTRYKVWGMTARMLVDAATLAYGEQPEFEHQAHFGDEKIIEALERMGRLGDKKKEGSVITPDDLREAAKKANKM